MTDQHRQALLDSSANYVEAKMAFEKTILAAQRAGMTDGGDRPRYRLVGADDPRRDARVVAVDTLSLSMVPEGNSATVSVCATCAGTGLVPRRFTFLRRSKMRRCPRCDGMGYQLTPPARSNGAAPNRPE
jgi:hypothetical protein